MKRTSTYIDTKRFSTVALVFVVVVVVFRNSAQSKRNLLIFPFFINFHLFIYFKNFVFPSIHGNFNL